MGHGRHPLDEVGDKPVQVLHRGRWAHALSSLPGSSVRPNSAGAAARPSLMPCWKLASRCLTCSAVRDAVSAGATVVTPPGTRFALGTRLGRPELVVPEDTGASATSAACQPASAGDNQPAEPGTGPGTVAVQSVPVRPRRNQSDSTDSKIGSRFSSGTVAGGGTITPGGAAAASPFTAAPAPSALGPLPLAIRLPLPPELPFVPYPGAIASAPG